MIKELLIEKTEQEYDALVIGSGVTGGWAAKEFCQRGLKTLMVERGRVVEHRKDYITEGKAPWEYPHRTRVTKELIAEQYKIQQQCYAFNDGTKHFFGNDKDLPYSTAKGTDFSWIRANQLGGKSLLWHRQSYRFSEYDFRANKLDGHGNDWPIRYKDLAPWYSYVEKHVGIAGSKEGLAQLPDSEFIPAFDYNVPELALKEKLATLFPERPMVMGRCAHLTQPTKVHLSQGRGPCQARNECHKGCSFGAYFSTQSSTLPAAVATGNLSIAPNSVVHSLIYDASRQRVRGVRVIDNDTLETREYFAKVVFLCASTLGTTQILLNSSTKEFSNGLANSSGALGRYLMDHNYNAGASGIIPGFEKEFYSGRRPTGFYIPNFQFEPKRYSKKYLRGYALAGGARRETWQNMATSKGIGINFKEKLTHAGQWTVRMGAQGEMLPRFENHVSLHATKKDKWGIPQLDIHCQWSENEKLMMADAEQTAKEMLIKAGVEQVTSYNSIERNAPGLAIHELGTARMGKSPKESVVNGFNQCHDIANLFVSDGASFCSTAVVNPSLTMMAITARAVDYAVKEMKQGRI